MDILITNSRNPKKTPESFKQILDQIAAGDFSSINPFRLSETDILMFQAAREALKPHKELLKKHGIILEDEVQKTTITVRAELGRNKVVEKQITVPFSAAEIKKIEEARYITKSADFQEKALRGSGWQRAESILAQAHSNVRFPAHELLELQELRDKLFNIINEV